MGYSPKELRWIGLGKELVAGIAVAPSFFIPVNDFSANDVPATVDDSGIRGTLAADNFGVYQSTLQGNSSLNGMVFPDSIGLLLLAIMGADTVTGGVAGNLASASSPATTIVGLTTPTFKIAIDGGAAQAVTLTTGSNSSGSLVAAEMQTKIRALGGAAANVTVVYTTVYTITSGTKGTSSSIAVTVGDSNDVAAALKLTTGTGATATAGSGILTHAFKSVTTSQPPSLTVCPYDPTTPNMRQFAYSMLAELDFKWAESAALEYSAKFNGKASVVGITATPSISQVNPILDWQFTAALNNTPNGNLVAFDLAFKRKITVKFPANNSQAPSIIIAGPLSVTGKMTFEKADDTELGLALNNTQQSVVLDSTATATQAGIKFTLTKAALKNPVVSGKDLIELDVDMEGIYNTTDGGSAQIALCNEVWAY